MRRFRLSSRIIVIGVILIAAALSVRAPRALGYAPAWLTSLQARCVRLGISVRTWVNAIGGLANAPEHILELDRENRELRGRITTLEHITATEDAIAAMGRVRTPPQWGSPVPARIIAGTFTIATEELLIDRGDRDGIRVGDPVVVGEAFIGSVTATNAHRSTIRLLADPGTHIGVMRTGKPGIIGILEADPGGGIVLIRIPRDSEIHAGTTIVTGTVNTGIPSGVPIGELASIQDDADGFFRHAVVIPLGDPKTVFSVTVLRQGSGP